MNNTINTQSGERLSFYKLFREKNYRILIPIIQRDYAQGRESTKEVRETFLDALYKYLNENKPNRDLDFIYGILKEVNGETDFIPLDGQQRLTTLFLLHWYLYQISDNVEKKEEVKDTLLQDGKSMFTYETRSSSSEFCDALMKDDIDFHNFLETDKDENDNSKGNALSKTIKNSSWYYLSWKYDPTIQSMLTMLDAIHKKFADKKEYFERLINLEEPIITFMFLNLKDFQLTDDLYIKMNSRGKPLTPFENFKAKFEQSLDKIGDDRKFSLNFGSVKKDVSLRKYFSYNIDTKWANLFWNYRDLQNRSDTEIDDTFDDELMNFIRVIFTNQYAMNVKVLPNKKDDTLEYLLGSSVAQKDKEYSDIISFNKYQKLKAISQKGILYLIDAFDSLNNGNKEIKRHLTEKYKFYFNETEVFKNALKFDFQSNHERLCFHAYIRYLIFYKKDRSGINQWMRVIHNLTHPENTIIDNASEVANAIQSIEKLLPQSKNILKHLKEDDLEITLFSSWQVSEEKIKGHLITKNDKWKEKIEQVEKHDYFNGQIGFILEFAGIIEYYKNNNNCDWSAKKDGVFFRKFSDYADKASKVFEESYENRKNDKDYIFERAVLTKGDYLTTASQFRKNLLSTNLVKNNIKRDHSWKRLLRTSDDKEWRDRRLLVKQVFDDKRFDKDNIKDSLQSICKDTTNTWRDNFINCPSLIGYCKQGFILFESKNNILLYGQSQSNHLHAEMFTYYLWKKEIEQSSLKAFEEIKYHFVKSIEDDACIKCKGFIHNWIRYQIEIYYCNNDELLNSYEITFRKSRGEQESKKYGHDIKNILNKCNFDWNNEHKCYGYICDGNDTLIGKLKLLNKKLNEINK